jgi:predicted ester cyclase
MSAVSDRNKKSTEEFFQKVFNEGDMSVVDTLLAPGYKYNGHAGPVASTKMWAQGLRQKFPDLHFAVEAILAEDDKVALRWRMTGTDTQSGIKVTASGTNILVFVNGQAVSNDQGGGTDFTPVK